MYLNSRGAHTHAQRGPTSRIRRRRTRIALLTSATLAGALIPVIAMANLAGSAFESTDGNLTVVDASDLDWVNVTNLTAGVELASGKTDNSLGQGAKEDLVNTTVVNGSIPPNKSDLTRFYIANEKSSGDEFMYLAWERTNTLGSANMDFEINKLEQPDLTTAGAKTLNRSLGDLLIRFDFSNGGTTPTLTLVKWITASTGSTSDCFKNQTLPCWGALPDDDALDGVDDEQVDLSQAGFADGSINSVTVSDPIAGVSLPTATFGEAAINLSDSGVFEAGECTSFGSAYLKSRSSDAFDAELKDFVAPQAIDINNCGGLTIRKVTVGGHGTFDYTSNTLDPDTFSLTTTAAGSAGAADTGSDYAGILAGTYDVAETAQDGWTLTGISCKNADDSAHAATTDLDAGTLSVDIAVDDDVTCTFTNTAKATLIVAKETLPDGSAQSFTFTKTSGFGGGNGGTFPLTDGQNTGTSYSDLLPGNYVVTETVPSGWKSPPAIACTGDVGDSGKSSGSGTAATFDLQAGETVTCTFTNTELAKVTITKTDDDDPANAVNGAVFGIYEDKAPDSTSSPGIEDYNPALPNTPAPVASCTTASGTCSTGKVLDPAKAYWVVETTTPSGYTTADPQRITPSSGQNVELTFVDKREFTVITIVCQNSDDSLYPSSVTLDKETTGSDSGTSLDADGLADFLAAHPGADITEAQLCSLTGAVFTPRHVGSYDGNVDIPQ